MCAETDLIRLEIQEPSQKLRKKLEPKDPDEEVERLFANYWNDSVLPDSLETYYKYGPMNALLKKSPEYAEFVPEKYRPQANGRPGN